VPGPPLYPPHPYFARLFLWIPFRKPPDPGSVKYSRSEASVRRCQRSMKVALSEAPDQIIFARAIVSIETCEFSNDFNYRSALLRAE
jgi:hypothetical protein